MLVDAPPILDPGTLPLPLRAPDVFGHDCPVELEIGVGKGLFLLEWGAARPEIGLLGVERTGKYLRLAALRVARRGLANVRLVQTTAEDLLFRCLDAASVAAVHVYFPDPWPKARHHKRRLFSAENVRRIAEVLVPGGLLRVKTDHPGYAAVIERTLTAEAALEPAAVGDAFQDVPASSYEIKYEREARRVYRFAHRRRAGTAPEGVALRREAVRAGGRA